MGRSRAGHDDDARGNGGREAEVIGGGHAVHNDAHLVAACDSIDYGFLVGMARLAGQGAGPRAEVEAAVDARDVSTARQPLFLPSGLWPQAKSVLNAPNDGAPTYPDVPRTVDAIHDWLHPIDPNRIDADGNLVWRDDVATVAFGVQAGTSLADLAATTEAFSNGAA